MNRQAKLDKHEQRLRNIRNAETRLLPMVEAAWQEEKKLNKQRRIRLEKRKWFGKSLKITYGAFFPTSRTKLAEITRIVSPPNCSMR